MPKKKKKKTTPPRSAPRRKARVTKPSTRRAPAQRASRRWPFETHKNEAVITLKRIIDTRASVLFVVRDANGDWQFLDGEDVTVPDGAIAALGEMVTLIDPSLIELGALPPGFTAWRKTRNSPWIIRPST